MPPRWVAICLPHCDGVLLACADALATVVAAPLGSYLGATVGWRGAFLYLVPLAVLAFVWQCISLPSMKSPRAPQRQGSVLR
ncbi:hypothetical protein K4G90_23530, partial [Mycobacterium tuberculosis]|nr:hypothetical protein [Mycobacterium tuberculosis]